MKSAFSCFPPDFLVDLNDSLPAEIHLLYVCPAIHDSLIGFVFYFRFSRVFVVLFGCVRVISCLFIFVYDVIIAWYK